MHTTVEANRGYKSTAEKSLMPGIKAFQPRGLSHTWCIEQITAFTCQRGRVPYILHAADRLSCLFLFAVHLLTTL